jgi:LGFP repeat/Alpha-L-arabinofuranosidase B (ABFB) domain
MRQSRPRGLVVLALAGLMTVGLVPVAVAAPGGPPVQVRRIGPDEPVSGETETGETPSVAAEVEKVRAAFVLGLVPTDEQLRLPDKDFVILLWRRATGAEVRASAELAFASSDAACTDWIRTGIHAANARDQANEMRDAEAARIAREVKEQALIVLGIVPEPELVIRSDRDFIYEVIQRATGPRVHAAALTAFGQPAAEQREFIASGIRIAHAGDQQDRIDADQQADAEEKARLAAEAARGRAVSVVRVVPTPDIVSLPNDDILRVIADAATPGSEVEKAAVQALRDRDRAVWKAFIDQGVFDAYRRDKAIVLQQKYEADRRVVEGIKARADDGGLQPRLSRAAAAALAGGPDEVGRFLGVEQYEVLTQSLSTNALNGSVAGHYLREADGALVVRRGSPVPTPDEGLDATWRIVPGLANPECRSLESATRPNHYLARHHDGTAVRVDVLPTNGTTEFYWNATWCVDTKLPAAGVTIRGGADYLRRGTDGRAGVGQLFYWWVTDPNPDSTEITLHWLNRYLPDYDPYADLSVRPTGPEQVDGSVRFRDFRELDANGEPYPSFRLYWSAATGVHRLSVGRGVDCPAPELLDAYLRLGGHASALGPPSSDDACTADRRGRHAHFGTAGSIYSTDLTGAHAVQGAIRAKWVSLGAERSALGYPTSDELTIPGGRRSTFEHGRIDYDSATGAVTVFPTTG